MKSTETHSFLRNEAKSKKKLAGNSSMCLIKRES